MILITLAALLVLGIALFHVGQGAFSSFLMAVLSILAAAAAFNFYEPMARAMQSAFPQQDGAVHAASPTVLYGASLVAIFLIALLGLRTIFDLVIKGNVSLGTWGDRIGGGVFGLIAGMVIVGVVLVAIQMLPWDGNFLGVKPYDATLQRDQSFLPFKPDRFVVGMTENLSAGSLGTGKAFTGTHPDLLLELFANRNRADLPGRCEAQPDDMKVKGVYNFPQGKLENADLARTIPDYPRDAKTPKPDKEEFYVVRANISGRVADEDRWYRLPATQFRLVTVTGEGEQRQLHYYYPVAFLTYYKPGPNEPIQPNWSAISRDNGSKVASIGQIVVERNSDMYGGGNGLDVDWLYRIPAEEKPYMLIFRNISRFPADGDLSKPLPALPFPENLEDFYKTALQRNKI